MVAITKFLFQFYDINDNIIVIQACMCIPIIAMIILHNVPYGGFVKPTLIFGTNIVIFI